MLLCCSLACQFACLTEKVSDSVLVSSVCSSPTVYSGLEEEALTKTSRGAFQIGEGDCLSPLSGAQKQQWPAK